MRKVEVVGIDQCQMSRPESRFFSHPRPAGLPRSPCRDRRLHFALRFLLDHRGRTPL
jgi:hypothetical protein